MPTTRPFAYNSGTTISGTEQVGSIAIGVSPSLIYSQNAGGVRWWNGPDEDLGYVIAHTTLSGTQPNPDNVPAYIGFWRSSSKTENSFITLTNSLFGTSYSTGNQCQTYLNNNGYWTSFTSDSNLKLHLDSSNPNSYSGAGTTWYDLSGNGNNATLFNSPIYSSSYDGILQFDDVSLEYATIPNIGTLSIWSVEVWFRLTTALTGKVTSIISNQFNNSVLNFSIGTNNMPTNSNLAVGFYNVSNGGWKTTAGFVPVVGNWYQVVGTYDGTTVRQYVNGVASGGTLTTSVSSQSGGEIRMMRRWDETLLTSNLVDGDLAIVNIYDSVISSNQVLESYNNTYSRFIDPITPVMSNIVLYYDPSNLSSYSGSGTTINDLSGNGRNGTMTNITFTSPYFTYNGTSSSVSIADNALLEPGSGSWTMEVWLNQSVSGNDVVLGKFDNGGLSIDVSYSIRTIGTAYYAQIGSGSGSGSNLFVNSTSYTGSLNTWYQIVYVFKNGGTKTLETFVNGVSIGSVNHNLSSILNSTNPLYLGSYNGGEFSQWFDGKIGITRLYNTSLTSTQVLQNFNADKSKYGL
jgi:hypothetical protein